MEKDPRSSAAGRDEMARKLRPIEGGKEIDRRNDAASRAGADYAKKLFAGQSTEEMVLGILAESGEEEAKKFAAIAAPGDEDLFLRAITLQKKREVAERRRSIRLASKKGGKAP